MRASQPGGYLGGHHVPLPDQYIAGQLRAIRPMSIIDFGAGRGLLGYLIRAVLGSTVDIAAVERFEPACRRLQAHPGYDRVVQRLIEEYEPPSAVDVSLYGDVLEHLPRRAAFAEIRRSLEFSHHVLVAVPLRNLRWNYDEDNPLEIHRAYLCESDF